MIWKATVFVALGLVLGYALSGIPARRELAALRAQRDKLQAELDNASRPNLLQAFLPGLSGPLMRPGPAAPGGAADPRPAARATAGERTGAVDPRPAAQGDVVVIGGDRAATSTGPAPAAREADGTPASAPAAAAPANPPSDQRARFARGSNQLLSNFDQLVTAQRVRTAAARAALIEQAGLDSEQMEHLDGTVARMNDKLEGYGEEMIDQAASEEPPKPGQALGLGHDVSGILYDGQKELDALVGDKTEAVDPSALQIWNYVDVEQWRPYVEQQLAAQQGSGAGNPLPAGGAAGTDGKGP